MVRPYLLAYAEWRENLEPGQPIVIPGCSPIAVALDLCLTNKSTYLASRARFIPPEKFTRRLYYTISGSRSRDGFLFVTDAMMLRFNSFILHALHNDLADRIFRVLGEGVDDGQQVRGRAKAVMLEFMTECGIDELVEYDALAKANYRLRTHRGFAHQRGRNWTYSPTAMQFISNAPKIHPAPQPSRQLRLAL